MADTITIPEREQDLKDIRAVISDISNQMVKMEGIRTYIKEAKKSLSENHEIPLKAITAMVKLYHKQEAEKHFDVERDLEEFYDALFPEQIEGK